MANTKQNINKNPRIMKRTILILATVVLGLTTLNAATENKIPTNETSLETATDNIAEVYDWSVTTKSGKSNGTSHNLKEAKRMIALFSNREIVLEQHIKSYKILNSQAINLSDTSYFWKVESNCGKSAGFTLSITAAKKMIALVAKGDIVTYSVIASKKI